MLKQTITLTLATVLCQAGLFIVASNTFGLGIYFVMHGSREGSITALGAVVLALCGGGLVLSQGLAPLAALALTRALPGAANRRRSVLVVASILGPVVGLAVAFVVGRLFGGPASGIGDIVIVGVWGFTDVAIMATAVFWCVLDAHVRPLST
jgi:hypothetical protein